MRIALLVVLAFAGLWMVVLRPKPADDVAAPPAPANGAVSAPAKAQNAVDQADKASAKADATAKATAESTPAKPAAPKASKPEATKTSATKGPAATPDSEGGPKTRNETRKVKRVVADLADKKVVVLLFWDRRSADDREVYRAAEAADRHGGKVSVRAAPIQRLGDYDTVTKGLPIAASPAVVVIDRAKQATVISGLTVTEEIDAAVNDALGRKAGSK
jgi:hypothetical protein